MRALAERLAAGPTTALASMKQALGRAAQRHLDEQLDLEADLQQRHGPTADYAEGRAAFAERRTTRFLGH